MDTNTKPKHLTVKVEDKKTYLEWKIAAALLGESMSTFAVLAIREKLNRMSEQLKPALQNAFTGRSK